MITTWYLHSHRTWDRLCHSCIGSSFLPHGAFPEGGAYAVLRELHAGSLEAHWVTRPEAVDLEYINCCRSPYRRSRLVEDVYTSLVEETMKERAPKTALTTAQKRA